MGVSTAINAYLDSAAAVKMLSMGLPPIRGTWFFVDPLIGSASNDGRTPSTPFASIVTAYDACTTNIGDGICILSADATTTANTTSYITGKLAWSKNSITVYGVCAPTRMAQRARIGNLVKATTAQTNISQQANSITRESGSWLSDGWAVGMTGTTVDSGSNNGATFTITVATALVLTISETFNVQAKAAVGSCTMTSYMTGMIDVSGSNNAFYNLHLSHTGSQALDYRCLVVSGARNYFYKVHAGVGLANAATVIGSSLTLLVGADENTFESCTFGLDTVDRGNNASYDILLSGAIKRNRFIDCETVGYVSTGVAKVAVYLNATEFGQPTLFDHCRFICNNVTEQTVAFSGTGANSKMFITGMSCHPGYAALTAAGGLSGAVWFNGATNASAVGGIASKT